MIWFFSPQYMKLYIRNVWDDPRLLTIFDVKLLATDEYLNAHNVGMKHCCHSLSLEMETCPVQLNASFVMSPSIREVIFQYFICYEQLCALSCFHPLLLLLYVYTYLFCEMSLINNDVFLVLFSGPGLVWGGRGNYHSLCGAFCNFTHSYSQCHRRSVAGETLSDPRKANSVFKSHCISFASGEKV